MTSDSTPPRTGLRAARYIAWALVALAIMGIAALFVAIRSNDDHSTTTTTQSNFGGPFTLVGADGKPFSSQSLEGKPYALYFGYTRCGEDCPTTLARLVKLRAAAGGPNAMHIVFVTIDPANDGPKEVGQYATLFNAPIIGLTGSQAQIDAVKKQFGIYAKPEPMNHGMVMIDHTATVLLFDRNGKFAGTIASDEPDSAATAKLKHLNGA
jgi:protein SCO1/2